MKTLSVEKLNELQKALEKSFNPKEYPIEKKKYLMRVEKRKECFK